MSVLHIHPRQLFQHDAGCPDLVPGISTCVLGRATQAWAIAIVPVIERLEKLETSSLALAARRLSPRNILLQYFAEQVGMRRIGTIADPGRRCGPFDQGQCFNARCGPEFQPVGAVC